MITRSVQVKPKFARSPHDALWRTALGGFWKRAFDLTISTMGLLVLTPIFLLTAGLVRLLLGKPAISADVRIGYGGRAFACYVFRGNDWAPENCLAQGSSGFVTDTGPASGRLSYGRRAQGFGRVLRASGLDKLPQLLNVVQGDLSLIGPRPIAASERLQYRTQLPEYFIARPGLTGLWRQQCDQTPRLSPLALDRYYIRHWSLRLDLSVSMAAISAF